MAVYTAVRYRNDMSVFDHHSDGIARSAISAATKHAPPAPSVGPRKTFSASQVMMMLLLFLRRHSVLRK